MFCMYVCVCVQVVYPGLKSYEQYELAQRQTDGPGAMISIYIKGGLPYAGAFLSRLKVDHHLSCTPIPLYMYCT